MKGIENTLFEILRQKWIRRLVPPALVLAALSGQLMLRPFVAGKVYLLFYPAIFFGGIIGGLWPGFAATGLASLCAWYFFVPEVYSFRLTGAGGAFGLIVFTSMGIAFSLFGELVRSSRLRERDANRELVSKNAQVSETEAKFRGLLESAHDAILIVNAEGKIDFVNAQVSQWFGYKAEELLGQPIEILVPDRVKEAHVAHRNRFLAHPMARAMGTGLDLWGRRKDGTEFPVDISLSPFKAGQATLVNAIIRDVSLRQKIEWQQRFLSGTSKILGETLDYQDRLQGIADLLTPQLADWCVVYALEGNRLLAKAVSHRTSSVAALLQETVERYPPRDDRPFAVARTFRARQAELFEHIPSQMWVQTGPEDDLPQRLRALNLTSLINVPLEARGKVIGVLSLAMADSGRRFSRDDLGFAELVANRAAMATDNSRLYREAQAATQIREEVLAIVSHDLKNPLSAIRTSEEFITKILPDCREKPGIERALKAMALATGRMQSLIGDLLDFSHIREGAFHVETKSTSIPNLVGSILESMSPLAKEKAIQMRWNAPNDFPLVSCDPNRISQVFANIIGNAIKFTPQGGRIEITGRALDHDVQFSISDTGPGIPKEELPLLFQRYWQAKGTARLGSGLGLSIAKGIVEAHGGVIWAESEEGKGSTFHFKVPRAAKSEGLMMAEAS